MYQMRLLSVFILVATASSYSAFCYSAESVMCQGWYEEVERANSNLTAQGKNLSKLAKETIFSDTKLAIQRCMKDCEKEKFKFCNDFANYLEK